MGRHLKKWIIEAEQQGRKTRWIRPQELHPEGIPSHEMFRTRLNEVVKNIL